MAFRQPLTRAELHEIGARSDPADVNVLLWELKRLGSIVLRADQLQRSLGELGGSTGAVLAAFSAELVGEPCLEEQRCLSGFVK